MSDLQGFDIKAGQVPDPDLLRIEFERFYHNVLPYLRQGEARLLVQRISNLGLCPVQDRDPVEYGANYDIKIEVQNLIEAVRAMRDTVIDEQGRAKEGITPREIKETVTATTSLMTLLMKSHAKLMNFDRMRALEQATVETLQELSDSQGEEIVKRFVERMEARLESD